MANNELIMTLGKVLIAAAWADGTITEEEVNSLKDLLWRLPAVHAREWDELDIYLDSPIDAPERERLAARLRDLTTSAEARDMALQALDDMIAADGDVSERERAVVDDLKRSLETAEVGLWGSFSRMLVGRRAKAVAGAPSRETYLNDFVRNRVYYKMRQRLATENVGWEISDDELRRLGLAGGLLALVSRVADDVSAEERGAMAAALQSTWALSAESAAFVVEVALANGEKLDLYRLAREFSEVTTNEERRHFLGALFAVAGADDKASYEEIEQIRLIALGLKLSHQEFIDAKMKLPPEKRA